MGTTRGKKKSGSRKSRKCDVLQPLSKQVLKGGNTSGANQVNWSPDSSRGVYTVSSVTGALQTSSCPNNAGKDGPPGTATFVRPASIDVDSAGNILVMERDTSAKLRMISPAGNTSTLVKRGDTIDGALATRGGIHNASMCAVNKATDVVYFPEYAYHQFRSLIADSGKTFSGKSAPGFTAGLTTIVSTNGNETLDGDQGSAKFHHPVSIAIDPRGTRMYIGEESSKCLRMIDITGAKTCYVSTLFKARYDSSDKVITNITVDNNGNLFFVLSGTHAIWKYVPPAAGVKTTGGWRDPLHTFDHAQKGPKLFAGNPATSGYNDGNATDALFNVPLGLCVDGKNNLYVADSENNVIRYITPDGTVYTYAGVQSNNPNLDNPLNHDGNGPRATAKFSNPISVAMDVNGDLFVLDGGKNRKNDTCTPYARVRKISRIPPVTINAVTTNSITVSWPPLSEWMSNAPPGEDTSTYSYIITPSDRDFEVFDDIQSPLTISNLSDSARYTIQIGISNGNRKVTTPPLDFVTKTEPSRFAIRTPVTTTVSGKSGTAVANVTTTVIEWDGAKGTDTLSYSIDPPDALSRTSVTMPRNQKSPYCIADLDPNKTYTVTLTASITNAPPINGQPSPVDTVVSNPSIFTTAPPRPMEIGTICGRLKEGQIVKGGETTNASKIPREASTTSVKNPRGIALDKRGNLFVTSNSCVLKITPPTDNVYVYMRGEVPSIFFPTPHTTSNSSVTIYAGRADNTGSDNNNPSNTTGDSIRFYNMSGMAYDPVEDAIYIADSQLHVVVKLTSDSAGLVTSKLIGLLAGYSHLDGPVDQAKFHTPKGIAIGPDGSLFIADCYNHAVRRIFRGNVTTISRATPKGDGNYSDTILWYPYGVAALYDGTVYVSSTWRHCIKKLTPNPDGITYTTTVYAGSDSDNGSDADGNLLDARFNKPQGLFVDVNNNIYVYDAGNYKIKLISGGRVMTVFGGHGYENGSKDNAKLRGPPLSSSTDQTDFGGITSDNNGNIYFTDCDNGFVRCAFPEPPPVIDKATFDSFWQNRDASSAHAQTTSSARQIQASSAKIQRASSSVANKASSALAQRESTAQASAAENKQASSSVQERASSALAQRESTAQASSALAQAESSPLAQIASSAVAQTASTAQASSAVAQGVSSALAQTASSALAEKESSAKASSAVAQGVSSALAQTASSALAQVASSAVAQTASRAQASSARQQQALAQPVSLKDTIVRMIKSIQSDLTQQVAVLYSKTSTESEINAAKDFITANIADLEGQWVALSQVSARIFAIAPMYQDRALQTAVYDDRYIESKNLIKMYDFMRKKHIVIDSNGYIVSNVDALKKRLR